MKHLRYGIRGSVCRPTPTCVAAPTSTVESGTAFDTALNSPDAVTRSSILADHVNGAAGSLKQQSATNFSTSSLSFTMPAQSIVALMLSGSGSGGGGSLSTKPSAPSGLTASSESSSAINLSWTAVSAPANCSIRGYSIYRSITTGSTPLPTNLVAAAASISYSSPGLNASATDYDVIEAKDMDTMNSENANQEWEPASLGNKLYKFVNLNSGFCPDATRARRISVQLRQWSCRSGDANQEFKLTLEP